MMVPWDRLDEAEMRKPGFLVACEEQGQWERKGLVIDSKTYDDLREKFGFSRGLGDTVAKVTKAMGLRPCRGCRKRQAKLNQLLPYS